MKPIHHKYMCAYSINGITADSDIVTVVYINRETARSNIITKLQWVTGIAFQIKDTLYSY